MGQAMGQLGSNLKNAGSFADSPKNQLDGSEKGALALRGGLTGGLSSMSRQQQQPQGGGGQMTMLPQAPQYDFSQIQKKSPFFGY